jgi:uncharacterized protein (DUF3820 family)
MQSQYSGSPGAIVHTDPDLALTCPKCGSSDVATKRLPNGQDRARCLECRRVWLTKAPWSYERAKNFCMPYGKHEGRRLSDLAETDGGLGYLRWLAANVKGNVGIAARIMLDDVDLKRMSK